MLASRARADVEIGGAMSRRTFYWFIPLLVAFLLFKAADQYLVWHAASEKPAASGAREVTPGEFMAAVAAGSIDDGLIGYRADVPGLADLAGTIKAADRATTASMRTRARLTDEDVRALRAAGFREGDLTLTAVPQPRRALRETLVALVRGTSQVLGWGLLLGAIVIAAQYIAARSGGLAPKTFQATTSAVKFSSVAGCDEAKEEVSEIVEFLRAPQRFEVTGGRMPRGVLLVGPPGTGKTMLAKAVAGEANANFYSLSGSDFVEMYVGVGASRIRSLFKKARENAPSIIFIDELDAVARQRSASGGNGGQQEHEHTLNALLVEMDGFASDAAVVVFGATNRPEIMDRALLRPGRFDRQVNVGLPDVKGREEILRVHAGRVKLDVSVQMTDIAKATPGFSGADLANLINEGALHAARHGRRSILPSDIEEARDKISWGREHRRAMTDSDKRIIAVHEAGHALMQIVSGDDSWRLHKVTIIPRGQSLGSTQFTPERDLLNLSKDQVLARIRCLMGGRVAEEILIGGITSGASGDIQEASRLARQMVFEWGMSDFGFLALVKPDGEPLGSSESLHEAEASLKKILAAQYEETTRLLSAHRAALERISHDLIARETISGDEVRQIVASASLQSAA